jgi:hypothetical protein
MLFRFSTLLHDLGFARGSAVAALFAWATISYFNDPVS